MAVSSLTGAAWQLIWRRWSCGELRSALRLPWRLWAAPVCCFVLYGLAWPWALAASTARQVVGVNLINYLWPILTVVFSAWWVPGVRLTGRLLGAMLLAVAGLALANLPQIRQMLETRVRPRPFLKPPLFALCPGPAGGGNLGGLFSLPGAMAPLGEGLCHQPPGLSDDRGDCLRNRGVDPEYAPQVGVVRPLPDAPLRGRAFGGRLPAVGVGLAQGQGPDPEPPGRRHSPPVHFPALSFPEESPRPRVNGRRVPRERGRGPEPEGINGCSATCGLALELAKPLECAGRAKRRPALTPDRACL